LQLRRMFAPGSRPSHPKTLPLHKRLPELTSAGFPIRGSCAHLDVEEQEDLNADGELDVQDDGRQDRDVDLHNSSGDESRAHNGVMAPAPCRAARRRRAVVDSRMRRRGLLALPMAAAVSHLHEERREDIADELRRAQAENLAADRGGQVDAQVHDDLRYQDTDRRQDTVLAGRNPGYIDVMNQIRLRSVCPLCQSLVGATLRHTIRNWAVSD